MLASAQLLQTHPGPRRLLLLLQDGVVMNVHRFSMRLERCYFTTEKGCRRFTRRDLAQTVDVQPSPREELIQRSSPCRRNSLQLDSAVIKVAIRPCDSNHSESSQELPRQTSTAPSTLGLREVPMTSETYWRPSSLLEN